MLFKKSNPRVCEGHVALLCVSAQAVTSAGVSVEPRPRASYLDLFFVSHLYLHACELHSSLRRAEGDVEHQYLTQILY